METKVIQQFKKGRLLRTVNKYQKGNKILNLIEEEPMQVEDVSRQLTEKDLTPISGPTIPYTEPDKPLPESKPESKPSYTPNYELLEGRNFPIHPYDGKKPKREKGLIGKKRLRKYQWNVREHEAHLKLEQAASLYGWTEMIEPDSNLGLPYIKDNYFNYGYRFSPQVRDSLQKLMNAYHLKNPGTTFMLHWDPDMNLINATKNGEKKYLTFHIPTYGGKYDEKRLKEFLGL